MSESDQGGAGRREVAWRVFAAEFDDATLEYSESDEERAPNYVVTPTGARVNRLFAVGVLTEVEAVSDDVRRGRVVDPTGAFVVYGGQYQPDAMAFLEKADPPAFVAVTGKARTFQPEDSDQVYTSIRPESINGVDAETRDRWTVQTAQHTLGRVSAFDDALDLGERGDALRDALRDRGVETGLAAGIPLALDHYGTTREYLAQVWDVAVDAARVVTGEIDTDEVGPLSLAPGEGGDEVDVDLSYSVVEEDAPADDVVEAAEPGASDSGAASEPEATADGEAADEASQAGVTEADVEPEPDAEAADDEEIRDAEDAAERGAPTESEPDVEPEQETVTEEEFEPETDDDEAVGTGGAGDEMYEFDDEERERIEEEYGTEFSTGSEVGEPGEADIDTPDPADLADETAAEAAEAEPVDESEPAEEPEATEAEVEPAEDEADAAEDEPEPGADETEPAEEEGAGETPDDLEDAVMAEMEELNEGDGVERERLLAAVVDAYDVTPDEVEDALQEALMAGRCYESGEDTLKPI